MEERRDFQKELDEIIENYKLLRNKRREERQAFIRRIEEEFKNRSYAELQINGQQ